MKNDGFFEDPGNLPLDVRDFTADEIEVRIAENGIKDRYVVLLLYYTASATVTVLNEMFGAMGWSNRFESLEGGKVYCTIEATYRGITCEKTNAGKPSKLESVKGEASDAFKRAAAMFGVGASLKTAPKIHVPISEFNIVNDGEVKCFDELSVSKIKYTSDHRIKYLAIRNLTRGREIFSAGLIEGQQIDVDKDKFDSLDIPEESSSRFSESSDSRMYELWQSQSDANPQSPDVSEPTKSSELADGETELGPPQPAAVSSGVKREVQSRPSSPISTDIGKSQPKRKRGRPPKSQTEPEEQGQSSSGNETKENPGQGTNSQEILPSEDNPVPNGSDDDGVPGMDSEHFLSQFFNNNPESTEDEKPAQSEGNSSESLYFDFAAGSKVQYDPETDGKVLINWGPRWREKLTIGQLDLNKSEDFDTLVHLVFTYPIGQGVKLHDAAVRLFYTLPEDIRDECIKQQKK